MHVRYLGCVRAPTHTLIAICNFRNLNQSRRYSGIKKRGTSIKKSTQFDWLGFEFDWGSFKFTLQISTAGDIQINYLYLLLKQIITNSSFYSQASIFICVSYIPPVRSNYASIVQSHVGDWIQIVSK